MREQGVHYLQERLVLPAAVSECRAAPTQDQPLASDVSGGPEKLRNTAVSTSRASVVIPFVLPRKLPRKKRSSVRDM
jgi:hypothetical protein